ncbi:UDP-3-O-(3-hydroxymyristoyl)glucosamine N-acyltransferase, partial [Magnetococcales bacterium HHB-1]
MYLSQLADQLDLEFRGEDVKITGAAPLEEADDGDITFITEKKWLSKAKDVTAVVVPPKLVESLGGTPYLVSRIPAIDFARIAELFGAQEMQFSGIDRTASIHETSQLGRDVAVGAHAVIGPDVRIGDRTVIHPGAVIHERTVIGSNCVIQSNTVIGGEGFGYEYYRGKHQRIPHFGNVHIEDSVEIGANTTIDRARFGETRIGRGTRIDNLVQIAHNVHVGRNVLIIGQAGVAGSCRIEDGAVIGGKVGIIPHTVVGQGARVASGSGVIED